MEKHAEAQLSAIAMLRAKPSESRFAQPIDFMLDEHMRQRALCGLLDDLALAGRIETEAVAAAFEFLKSDFGLHVLDEEEDLFPLLRRRASEDERFMDVLDALSLEHTGLRVTVKRLIAGLEEVSRSKRYIASAPDFKKLLQAFSASKRRHLVVENAIVIPLARASLMTTDISVLGRRMAARRAIIIGNSDNAD